MKRRGSFNYPVLLLVLSFSSLAALLSPFFFFLSDQVSDLSSFITGVSPASLSPGIVNISVFVNDSSRGLVPIESLANGSGQWEGAPPAGNSSDEAGTDSAPVPVTVPIESFFGGGSITVSSPVQDFRYEMEISTGVARISLSGVPVSEITVKATNDGG